MLKLPPYGQTLKTLHKQKIPYKDDVYIFMGNNAWDKAKSFQKFRPTTMCLPYLSSPYDFYWPVKGHEIMLFDTSFTEILLVKNFIECLFSFGAKIILFITTDLNLIIYKKGF